MREIPTGQAASITIIVSETMTVDFEQEDPRLGKLHPVYATYWVAKHFELVSRKLTLPFLEEHEEGIGHELTVRHLAPAVPGTSVELRAVHQVTSGDRVLASCTAVSGDGRRLAVGGTTQVILPREELRMRFARLRGDGS